MVEAEQGLDDPLEADIAFHTSILIASGNRFFVQLTEFIGTALRVSIRYKKIKGLSGADVTKYVEIFNAIKARNPELSKSTVAIILDEALELIELNL
jgi:DNA-binding FadR family transcriptional regulator